MNVSLNQRRFTVAEDLVKLCQKIHFQKVIDRDYAPDNFSLEVVELPRLGEKQRGIEATRDQDT